MSDETKHELLNNEGQPVTILRDRDGEQSGTTGSSQPVVNLSNPPKDPGDDGDSQ